MNRTLLQPPSAMSRPFSIALLFILAACGPGRRVLVETRSEKSASEILVNLAEWNITARKERGQARNPTWIVTVPSDELPQAHKILLTLDLPRAEHTGFESMLADTGVIPSKANEHARLVYASSQELAATLEEHEQVLSARVHVVLPEETIGDRIGSDRPQRPTASVMLRYVPSAGLGGLDQDDPERARPAQPPQDGQGSTFANLYGETLANVFQDVTRNFWQHLSKILRGEIEDSTRELRQELSLVAEDVVRRKMDELRREAGRALADAAERARERGEVVMSREVAELERGLTDLLDGRAEDLRSALRVPLMEFVDGERASLQESFREGTRAAMADTLAAYSSGEQQRQDLALEPSDPLETQYFKLMMQDYYSLPGGIRRIAEERLAPDEPDLPFSKNEVRMLVAHAIEGMWPWDVNVVFSKIDRPSVRRRGATAGESDEVALAGVTEEIAARNANLEQAGRSNDLEDRNQRLGYLALALGATTLILLVLLTRERQRNGALRKELAVASA